MLLMEGDTLPSQTICTSKHGKCIIVKSTSDQKMHKQLLIFILSKRSNSGNIFESNNMAEDATMGRLAMGKPPAVGFTASGWIMTSCRLPSNNNSMSKTVHDVMTCCWSQTSTAVALEVLCDYALYKSTFTLHYWAGTDMAPPLMAKQFT